MDIGSWDIGNCATSDFQERVLQHRTLVEAAGGARVDQPQLIVFREQRKF